MSDVPWNGANGSNPTGLDYREAADRAFAAGDFDAYEAAMRSQWELVMGDWMQQVQVGQDPLRNWDRGQQVDYEVARLRTGALWAQREQQRNQLLDTPEFKQLKEQWKSVVDAYKEKNREAIAGLKEAKDPESQMRLQQALQPLPIPTEQINAWHEQVRALNDAMKQVDPSFNVWSHPETKNMAAGLLSLVGGGPAGYVTRADQPGEGMDYTAFAGSPTNPLLSIPATVAGWTADKLYGTVDGAMAGVGIASVKALDKIWRASALIADEITGGNLYDHYGGILEAGQSYTVDEQGNPVPNGHKIAGAEVYGRLRSAMTKHTVEEEVARLNAAEQYVAAKRNGFEELVYGGSHFAGSLAAFGPLMGGAMTVGSKVGQTLAINRMTKGMAYLATAGKITGRLSPKAAQRAHAITQIMAGTAGAMAGNGGLEASVYGDINGYGKSFVHGAVTAVPMIVLGHLGRRAERALAKSKMPTKLARKTLDTLGKAGMAPTRFVRGLPARAVQNYAQLGGAAVEGMGFGVWELVGPGLLHGEHELGPLWTFLREPTEENWGDVWKTLAINALGTLMFKGMQPRGETPGGGMARQQERELLAMGQNVSRLFEPETPVEQKSRILKEFEQQKTSYAERFGEEETVGIQATRTAAPLERAEAVRGVDVRAHRRERESARERRMRVREEQEEAAELKRQLDVKAKAGELPRSSEVNVFGAKRSRIVKDADIEEFASWVERVLPENTVLRDIFTGESFEVVDRAAEGGWRVLYEDGRSALMRAEDLMTVVPRPQGGQYGVIRFEVDYDALGRARTSHTIQPTVAGKGVESREKLGFAKRASEVIKDIEQTSTGSKVYFGRTHRLRWAGGWYERQGHIQRTQEANRINVATHEFAHGMQEKTLGLSVGKRDVMQRFTQAGMDELVLADLHKLGVDLYGEHVPPIGHYFEEGWAEYFARRVLGDTTLARTAPHMTRWVNETFLPRHPNVKQDLLKIADSVQTWLAQSARQRTAAFVHRADQQDKTPLDRMLSKIEKTFVDDLVALRKAQARVAKKAGIDEERLPVNQNPYRLASALRQKATGRTAHILYEEMVDFSGRRKGKALKNIFDEIPETKGKWTEEERNAWYDYFTAQVAIEWHRQGIEPGLDLRDAVAVVELFQGTEIGRRMDNAIDATRHFTKQTMDYAVEAGALTREAADQMLKLNPIYLPFKRWLGDPERFPQGPTQKGKQLGGAPIGGRKGSRLEIDDPFVAIAEQTELFVRRAHQQELIKAIMAFGRLGHTGEFAHKVDRRSVPAHEATLGDTLNKIKRQLEKLGLGKELYEDVEKIRTIEEQAGIEEGSGMSVLDELVTFFGMETMPSGPEPILVFQINGKTQFWEVDPDVYDTVLTMDKDLRPDWMMHAIMQKPAQLVRLGATGANLGFALTNIMRDAWNPALYGKDGINKIPFVAFLQGMHKQIKGHESARLYNAVGGRLSTMYGEVARGGKKAHEQLMPSVPKSFFENVVHPIEALKSVTKLADKTIRKIEQLNTYIESATRIQQFHVTLEKQREGFGTPEADITAALQAAAEISIDFARAGVLGRALNGVVPYINAAIQSKRKFVRTALGYEGARAQRQFLLGASAAIGGVSIANWLLHKDEEWYQELPEWQRHGYWTFKIGDQIFKIPKPFEVGHIFGTVPEMALDALYQDDPELAMDALKGTVGEMLDIPILFAAFRPAFEVASNYDFFRGRPIVPFYQERNVLPPDQFGRYTSFVGKKLGQFFNVSPRYIDHLISGHTGGSGLAIARWFDWMDGSRTQQQPSFDVKDVLPFTRLLGKTEFAQARSVDRFYDLRKLLNQMAGSEELTGRQRSFRSRVESAYRSIQKIDRRVEAGRADPVVADRRKRNIAKRIVDRWRQME